MAPIAFITSLWILTASAILLVLTLYRIQDKPAGLSFLAYRDGKLLIVAVIAFLCSGAMGIWYAMRLRKMGERPLRLALRWNVGPVGFQDDAVQRQFCSQLAKTGRTSIGHSSAKPQHEAELDVFPGLLH